MAGSADTLFSYTTTRTASARSGGAGTSVDSLRPTRSAQEEAAFDASLRTFIAPEKQATGQKPVLSSDALTLLQDLEQTTREKEKIDWRLPFSTPEEKARQAEEERKAESRKEAAQDQEDPSRFTPDFFPSEKNAPKTAPLFGADDSVTLLDSENAGLIALSRQATQAYGSALAGYRSVHTEASTAFSA